MEKAVDAGIFSFHIFNIILSQNGHNSLIKSGYKKQEV
jgi:hypothetical protein